MDLWKYFISGTQLLEEEEEGAGNDDANNTLTASGSDADAISAKLKVFIIFLTM